MQVRLAREYGFCFGVRRAIELMETTAMQGAVDSFGPVVHNPQVVQKLSTKGVTVIDNLANARSSQVAITAHGVGPDVIAEMQQRGLEVVDATCPIVSISQKNARRLIDDGYFVVIYGDANHREVKGVLGWCRGQAIATTNLADVVALEDGMPRRLGLLSQTTQNPTAFANFVNQVMGALLDRVDQVEVVSTLCNATSKQQVAALELAAEVEAMVVVGGKQSANTKHLAEVAAAKGLPTHHIESAADLRPEWFCGLQVVGVTAGASTPDDVVQDVVARLQEMG
ncbi:MAG: 4-hydroxy-3-methylbut-2-enyl diphosphate reductase [Chloroflexi bacterium]|nr:4-hydroxy-3-methylbut-2-enyl diphosphate reductase [Chloroflexota bacterium]